MLFDNTEKWPCKPQPVHRRNIFIARPFRGTRPRNRCRLCSCCRRLTRDGNAYQFSLMFSGRISHWQDFALLKRCLLGWADAHTTSICVPAWVNTHTTFTYVLASVNTHNLYMCLHVCLLRQTHKTFICVLASVNTHNLYMCFFLGYAQTTLYMCACLGGYTQPLSMCACLGKPTQPLYVCVLW